MKIRGIYFFLLASFAIGGCKLSDKQWDINMLVPLAHADLTINNLVNDSTLKKSADSSLYLVSVQPLKSLNISKLLNVPDTSFQKTVSLKTLTLGDRTLKQNITLGQVAKNPALGLSGQILIAENGHKLTIPPIANAALGETPVNATSLFTTATFTAGALQLNIYNGFPVALSHIHFEVVNQTNDSVVIADSISLIMPHTSFNNSYSLAHKTVSGNLFLNITQMSSPGSGTDSVLIDTSNAITVTLTGTNMQVSSATAVFPAQNLVNDSVDVVYNLRGPVFKSFIIRSGSIDFKTTSSIHDTMHITYTIPGATRGGEAINEHLNAPPNSTVYDSFPLNDYHVDLTGQHHNSTNTFYNILQVHLDSTGKLEYISLSDSIYIFYGLFHVVPEYAAGYLGTSSYTEGPETVPMDFFKNMSANKLNIPNLKVTLHISNGIGAPASAILRSITAVNSKTNKQIPLICSKYIGTPLTIPAANDTLSSTTLDLPLDNTNSNISDLLGILPDKLLYLFNFTVDPNGNKSNYGDFIYYKSAISASLNIQLPLELGADGLVLQDTTTTNLTNNIDLSRVQNGTMHIAVSNGYPLSAKLQLYILDNTNKITDSLFSSSANTIPAGSPGSGNTAPGTGTLSATLSQSQWQEIAAKKRLILKVTLNTANKQVVKIYSNTHFTAKITGQFRYRNSTN